jgi:hypothetical protein
MTASPRKHCQWVIDDDGTTCPNEAHRKWCDHHKLAAAAARSARHRSRNKNAGERDAAPHELEGLEEYIPRNSQPSAVQSGRTMPRPHDVPARAPRRHEEPEVIDYTHGGLPRSSIYDRKPDTVPADAGRDFVRAAKMRAGQTDPAKMTNLFDWASYAELGEEEYSREQNRRRMQEPNDPHRYDVVFTNPWNRGGYVDPSMPDQMDAPWSR